MSKYRTEEWKTKIIEAATTFPTMAKAASSINIPFSTFKRYAEIYGVYTPNQGGMGTNKNRRFEISLKEILEGKHPSYQSNDIRLRLLSEGLKEHKCESCENTHWLGLEIPLELEHIDGNPRNHCWYNLELLCPNCHALTPTYRGKNIGRQK
jgi:hypothetical protein